MRGTPYKEYPSVGGQSLGSEWLGKLSQVTEPRGGAWKPGVVTSPSGEFLFSSLGSSMFSKFSARNILPLKLDKYNNRNKANRREKYWHTDGLPTPLSQEDSHPWTMPPVNPKCSEKDSCDGMRGGSVRGRKRRPGPTPPSPPTQAQRPPTAAPRPHRC